MSPPVILFSVPSARTTAAPSGSFNAVVAAVVKSIPFKTRVLEPLSQVESSVPVFALLSSASAAAPPSAAVKSAVSVASVVANAESGNNDAAIQSVRPTVNIFPINNLVFIKSDLLFWNKTVAGLCNTIYPSYYLL